MLLFNFLCVFYLMLLCNGHTISKSIRGVENSDDIFDTPNESQSTRSFVRHRHDRIHNKFRRVPDAPAALQIEEIDEETAKETPREINQDAPLDAARNKFAKTRNLPVKTKKKLQFWRWNRNKSRKEKKTTIQRENPHKHSNEHNIRKVPTQAYNLPETRLHIPGLRESNKGHFHKLSDLDKYDVNHVTSDRGFYKTDESSDGRGDDYSLLESGSLDSNNDRLKRTPKKRKWHASKHKHRNTLNSQDAWNVEATVRNKANKRSVDTLAQKTSNSHATKSTKHSLKLTTIPITSGNFTVTESTTVHDTLPDDRKEPKTTTGSGYNGTDAEQTTTETSKMEEFTTDKMPLFNMNFDSNIDTIFIQSTAIEELLKHIKDKNFEYATGQNPTITSIVVGTVTKATFDAIPVHPNLSMKQAERHQSKSKSEKITIDDVSTIESTTPIMNVLDEEELNILGHNINERSVNHSTTLNYDENAINMQIKDLCNKLQHKAEVDLKSELASINSIIKQSMNSNDNPKYKTPKPLDYIKTTNFRDDYVMLNLYENLLAREHQTNIMDMLATQHMLSTSRDVKRDTTTNTYTEVTPSDLQEKNKYQEEAYKSSPHSVEVVKNDAVQQNPIQDISNKISYSDFVNGYKYYLDFQREQGQDNFSNQIKYQAHRHHNVDDIGKFILNRIPAVPSKSASFDYDSIKNASVNYDPSMKQFFVIIQPPAPNKTAKPIQLFEKNMNSTVTKTISENYDCNATKKPDINSKVFKASIDNKKDISLDVLTNILEETTSGSALEDDRFIKDSLSSIDSVLNLKIRDTEKGFHLKNLIHKPKPKAKSTTNHVNTDAFSDDAERISISLGNKGTEKINYAKRNGEDDYAKSQIENSSDEYGKSKKIPDSDYYYTTTAYTNADLLNEGQKKNLVREHSKARKREIKNCFKKLKNWVKGKQIIEPEPSTTHAKIPANFFANQYKLDKITAQSDKDMAEATDELLKLINSVQVNKMPSRIQVTESTGFKKGQTVGMAPETTLERTTPRSVTETVTIIAEEIRASTNSLASDSVEKKMTLKDIQSLLQHKHKHTTQATTRAKTTSKTAHTKLTTTTTLPEAANTSFTMTSPDFTTEEDIFSETEEIEKMLHTMSLLNSKTTESITDMIKRILSGTNVDALVNSTLSLPSKSTTVEEYMTDEKRMVRDYLSVAEKNFDADKLLKQINDRIKRLKSLSKNNGMSTVAAYNTINKLDILDNNQVVTATKISPEYFNDLLMWNDISHSANPQVSQNWEHVLSSLKPHGWSPRSYTIQRNNQLLNNLISSYVTATEANKLIPRLENMSTVNLVGIRHMYEIPTTASPQITDTIEDENVETTEFMTFENEPVTKLETTTPTAVKFDVKSIWPNSTISDEDDAEKIYDMLHNKKFKVYRQQKNQYDKMKTFEPITSSQIEDGVMYFANHLNAMRQNIKNPIALFDQKLFSTIPSYIYGPTSTLLPMHNEDFELFLKENSMDVQKVTRPLTELYKFIDTWTPDTYPFIPKPKKTINNRQNSKSITRSVHSKSIVNNTPDTISNIEIDARYVTNKNNLQATKTKFEDVVSYVPYEEHKHSNNYLSHEESIVSQKPNDNLRNTAKLKTFKKLKNKKNKIQIYEKQLASKRKGSDQYGFDNAMEITLISMNNTDNNMTELKDRQRHTDQKDNTTDSPYVLLTTKKLHRTMHENALRKSHKDNITKKMSNYFPINTSTSSMRSPTKKVNSNKKTTKNIDDVFSFSNFFNSTTTDNDYNNVFVDVKDHKLKPGADLIAKTLGKKNPQRIQVTSHSYKYDVIYDDSKRDTTSDFEQLTTETPGNETQIMSSYKSDEKTQIDTREIIETIEICRIVDAVVNSTNDPRNDSNQPIDLAPEKSLLNNDLEAILCKLLSIVDGSKDYSHTKEVFSAVTERYYHIEKTTKATTIDLKRSASQDRRARKARTTKYKSAPRNPVNHVTFIYDLKHLNRTDKDFNKKTNLKDQPLERRESDTAGVKADSLSKRDLEYDTNDIEGVLASNVFYNLFTKKSVEGSNNSSDERPDILPQSPEGYTKPPKKSKSKSPKKKFFEYFIGKHNKQNDTANKTHARRVRQDYRTDKDLQGLQVVLDFVKNLNDSATELMDGTTKPFECVSGSDMATQNKKGNNIDIHISIPVGFKMDEKVLYSDLPNNLWQVIKMYPSQAPTSLNIDYQSILQSITSTPKPGSGAENLTAGMYVLVDDPNMAVPRGKFLFKPIKPTHFKMGHNSKQFAPRLITFTAKPETVPEQRTTAKMPVSKDFVSAINKQLLDIYNNLTALAIPRLNTRKARTYEKKTKLQQLFDNIKNKEKSKNEHRNLRDINWNQSDMEQDNAANCSCDHLNHSHDHCTTICQMNKIKRQAKIWNNQVESPLITDSGGSFWYDYIHKGDPASLTVDKGTTTNCKSETNVQKPREKSYKKFNNFVTKYLDFHLSNKTDMHYSTGELPASPTKVTVTPTTITEQETKLPAVSTKPAATITRQQQVTTTESPSTSKIVIVTNTPSYPPAITTVTVQTSKQTTNGPNSNVSRSKISEDIRNDENIESDSYYLNKGDSQELDNFTGNVEQLMELIANVQGDGAEESNKQNEAAEKFDEKSILDKKNTTAKTNELDASANKPCPPPANSSCAPPANNSSPPPCPDPNQSKPANTTKPPPPPPPKTNNSCQSQQNQVRINKHVTEDYRATKLSKIGHRHATTTDNRQAGYIEHITTETFTTLPPELNEQSVIYAKTTPFPNFTSEVSKPLHQYQTSFPSTAPMELKILINRTYTKNNNDPFNMKNNKDLQYKIKPAEHQETCQNLLLSLLKYEKNKLNKEWKRFANVNSVQKNLESTNDNANQNFQATTKRSIIEETPKAASRSTKTTKLSMLQRLASKMGIQRTRAYKQAKATHMNLMLRSVTSKMYREAATTRKCKKKLYDFTTTQSTLSHVTTNETVLNITDEVTQPMVINETPPHETETEVTETVADDADNEDAKEECDPSNPNEKCICDLQATHDRVLENYKRMKLHDFENYVRNITCHKYKRLPAYFLLADAVGPHYKVAKNPVKRSKGTVKRSKNPVKRSQGYSKHKWDWIRRKRSLLTVDKFESYTKNNAGLYRGSCKRRQKRTLDTSSVIGGLSGLPGLDTDQDEQYVMVGDTVTLKCRLREDLKKVENPKENDEFQWKTDRSNMLRLTNVAVEGEIVTIRDLTLHNMGKYDCLHNEILIRTVMVTVVAVPVFHVIFVPIYNTEEICQYNDLTMVNEHLATQMQAVACPSPQYCTVRVDEPTCLKVEEDSLNQLRITAVISTLLRNQQGNAAIHCSPQCRRDMQCSLTLLSALAVPSLMKIALYVTSHDGNRTMSVSSSGHKKMLVTHTLKKKDSNNHHEYHRVSARMLPGDIDIVVSCPAGFYLLAKLKVCLACQANSYSTDGANECAKCPTGWHSDPGSERCHNPLCPRDLAYDYCGRGCRIYIALLVIVLTLCTLSVLCGARHCTTQRNSTKTNNSKFTKSTTRSYASAFVRNTRDADKSKAGRRDRHLSPSRVILARLFRSTPSPSSKLTDSQETRLGAWKGAKPPPLPPIDFEF